MAQPPPPYPGEQKGYPPPPNPAYPPQPQPSAAYGPTSPGCTQAPPPAYSTINQQNQQYGTTVVIQPTGYSVVQQFREAPVQCKCPYCQADVVSATHYETGTLSWIICLVLCLVGCNLGCCLVPFCVDGCRDVVHTCPNCRQHISRWSRM